MLSEGGKQLIQYKKDLQQFQGKYQKLNKENNRL